MDTKVEKLKTRKLHSTTKIQFCYQQRLRKTKRRNQFNSKIFLIVIKIQTDYRSERIRMPKGKHGAKTSLPDKI